MTPEELKAATERAKRVEAWRYGDVEARQTARDFLALKTSLRRTQEEAADRETYYREMAEKLEAERDRLAQELEIAQKFHDVAVKERDLARVQRDRLEEVAASAPLST